MCQHGDDVVLRLKTMAEVSHSGQDYWRDWGIDRCIAPVVKALQDGGIDMLGSCCGHGKADGSILLADGRELVIKKRGESKTYEARFELGQPVRIINLENQLAHVSCILISPLAITFEVAWFHNGKREVANVFAHELESK